MINKTTKILGVGVLLVGLAAAGLGVAQAATTKSGQPNFMSNLVNAIAQKFNLNPDEVQQVFDEQRAEQQSQMEAAREENFAARLTKAVSDGKLTQDQADKITAEKTKIDSDMAALQGKTGTEFQDGMKAIRDSVKQWATDNNIPQQYLMFGPGGRMGKGHGFGRWGFPGKFDRERPEPAENN